MARIRLSVIGTTTTPPAGFVAIYSKEDRRLYFQDDASLEREVTLAGSIDPGYQLPEARTITAAEAIAKALTLAVTPTSPERTELQISGAPCQIYDLDFEVVGDELIWSGKGLDGLLEEGDEIRILYV